MFNGNATFYVKSTKMLAKYPEADQQSDNSLESPDKTTLTFSVPKEFLNSNHPYKLIIEADNDMHASILVNQRKDLVIIPDGLKQTLTFNQNKEIQYLVYMPPSEKFHLTVNSKVSSLEHRARV